LNSYYQMLGDQEDLFIIWQTGVEAFDEMESLVKKYPRLILTPYVPFHFHLNSHLSRLNFFCNFFFLTNVLYS
jgi:hypothetical protein